MSIYVLKEAMSYIDGEYDDIYRALGFVLAMVLIDFVSTCSSLNIERIEIVNLKICHGIQTLVFAKVFKVTSSSNKKYKKGELNGLVNQEPRKLSYFLSQCSDFVIVPFSIASTVFSLYQIIGVVTIYALIILIAASIGMFLFSKLNSKLQRIMRRHDDERSNMLLEVVENIKVIKMNSYTQKFLDDIMTFRGKEYYHMIYDHLINFPNHMINFLTNHGLIFTVFFISVFSSNMSITVPLGITMMRLISHLKGRTSRLPNLLRGFYDSLHNIRRIENFLNCEGIEQHKYYDNGNTDNHVSVKIEQSNFFWGLDEAKFDEEPEEVNKTQNNDAFSISDGQDDNQKVVSLDTKV